MKVTPESIRNEALGLMRLHPSLSLEAATARAEEVLRIQYAEPAITSYEQWERATFEQQNEHLRLGFEKPLSPLELLTSDPDAYIAQYPDSADAKAFVEAARWEALSDAQRADEVEAGRLLKQLTAQRADMVEAARVNGMDPDLIPGLQVLVTQSKVGEGVRSAAEAVYKRQAAAEAAKASAASMGDARSDVDKAFEAIVRGEVE